MLTGRSRVCEASQRPTRQPIMLTALLGATIIGTLSNNSLNVPLHLITTQLNARLSAGVLVVGAFVLVLAAGMGVTGWIGDRFGRSRTLSVALGLMAAAQVGAALAPTLPVLVVWRAVQGLACSAIPPSVMGILAAAYPVQRRARVMSAWAAANGVGQALGAPFGGWVSDAWGWRAIFWLLVPLTLLVLLAMRGVPADRGRRVPLHGAGAASLTAGSFLVMSAALIGAQHAVPVWAAATLGACGCAVLVTFAVVSSRSPAPLIPPRLLLETRFARSAAAAFVQMFALAVVLIAVPLFLTGTLHRSPGFAGLVVFALPVTMTVLAPLVGAASDWFGARRVLRAGLALISGGCVALGLLVRAGNGSTLVLCALLVGCGAGVAMVQTPAATGATRSPAGQHGAALGLFNMLRFGGSAFGAAWVAICYAAGAPLLLYLGAALLCALGILGSFAGRDPVTEPVDAFAEAAF